MKMEHEMSHPEESEESRSAGQRSHTTVVAMGLLLAAHLPCAVPHYIRTWTLEHYQFFPFALGMFAWLFHTRRTPGAERWGVVCRLLLLADLICLACAFLLPEDRIGTDTGRPIALAPDPVEFARKGTV